MGVRGVVKREDLPQGRWRFEAHRMAWVSMDGKIVQLGMRLPLRITGIDFEKRFVDFAIAGKPTTEGTHNPPPRAHAKKHEKPKPRVAAKAGPPPTLKKSNKSRRRKRR
jgi:hypothetical protein